ncbi:AraC family transcriptional regulator [Bacteroides sp. 224]|uniref:AraC family transcriptional regulator n=1 Tax=Bacteroides sp. 224 TaxID=2302936 RepID=UPI0013D17C20|nr:AraC family transcriptional regulator [Bacteroides sp. 224]NDV64207.1 AraC family transcriptional regulator [Bacteroides sp. 224]
MAKNYNDLGVEFKYLIVNDMDRKFGLWVNTVGFQAIQPNSPYPIKDHPSGYYFNIQKGRVLHEYQIVYITKGRGLFSSDSTSERQVCKGRLMILFPDQWHTYQPLRQTGWNEYYIGFQGPIIDNLVQHSFLSKENQILEVGLNEDLVSLFSRALEIAATDKIAAQQHLSGVVLHILGLILSISKGKIFEIGDVGQKIEQAKIIMNENVFKDIDAEELAMKLNISYSWFRKVFKDYTGYAPAKYFQELKLRKAKQLLVETSNSVKEISFTLNYNSTEHFFALFKKHTGFTPLEYRSFGRGGDDEK